jgi:beta-lactamase regulating signal transducer with metallopeptidase domain
MSGLSWMHSGEVVALGWTLLHFCWQSTVIALLYAVTDRCLLRATAAVRYGVAMAMLGSMPVAAFATFVEQEQLVVNFEQAAHPVVASQIGSLHASVVREAPFAAPAMADTELWIASHADRLMPWIVGAWLTGVCLLALRAAVGWRKLRLLRRNAQLTAPSAVQKSFAKLISQLHLVHPVVLRVSTEVISPMAMGIWRTSVILPLSVATSFPAEQLEAVLAHELAHIRRWDYFCNLLQTAIECLFFFHPAVWWMSRRTRELREVCCDEIAARTCADPAIYAEALLQMEEQRVEHLRLAVALRGSGGALLRRIRRVMGEKTMEQGSMGGVRIAAAGLLLAGLATAPHLASALKAEPTGARIVGVSATTAGLEDPDASQMVATDKFAGNARAVREARRAEPDNAGSPLPATAIAAGPIAGSAATRIDAPAAAPNPAPPREQIQDTKGEAGQDYLEKMREAGYALDLNRDLDMIISLRSVGVTPEYAKAMAQVGWGVPTLKQLVSLKAVGVTPEYVAGLKSSSAAPSTFEEVISEKSVGVTPEYAKAMGDLGMGPPTMHEVISMKAVGITPEYVAELKAAGLVPADVHELISFRAVGVTPEYAKAMASAGFQGLSAHDLVSLKAQGVSPDYVHWIRTTFPNADLQEVRKAAVFHIDQEFMNKATAHSFNSTDLDKLVKLKMTGLLD